MSSPFPWTSLPIDNTMRDDLLPGGCSLWWDSTELGGLSQTLFNRLSVGALLTVMSKQRRYAFSIPNIDRNVWRNSSGWCDTKNLKKIITARLSLAHSVFSRWVDRAPDAHGFYATRWLRSLPVGEKYAGSVEDHSLVRWDTPITKDHTNYSDERKHQRNCASNPVCPPAKRNMFIAPVRSGHTKWFFHGICPSTGTSFRIPGLQMYTTSSLMIRFFLS